MIKLKRLKINRYRNVEPCDLVFGDRFNILLGANGAGKTTLLNLISTVLRTNLGDTSDPFSIEIEISFAGGTASGKFETFNETSTPDTELSPELRSLRFIVHGPGSAARIPLFDLRVDRVEPPSFVKMTRTATATKIDRNGDLLDGEKLLPLFEMMNPLVFAFGLAPSTLPTPETETLQALTNATRFDESLDMFRSIVARQDDAPAVYTEGRPAIQRFALGGKEATVIFNSHGIVAPSLRRMVETHFVPGMTDVAATDESLGFLRESCRLLGLRSATAKLELISKNGSTDPGLGLSDFGNLKFWFTRKDGSIFQDQHLSYGQKRLLTFLYYLEANPSIIIADELVNGLHHAWIKECMEAIGERQAFLTSQNPLLLDYLFFTSVQEVKESFILCRVEPVGDSEKMIWRNLTDDEAAMFYSAYKVGIEHVGEILRTRGLW